MYLSVLTKEEKKLFLGLAFDLALSDGSYSEKEKAIIDGYCQEMQIEFEQSKIVKPVFEIIESIKNISNIKSKKIIVFEAIGLVMADGNYDTDERKIIDNMIEEFSLEVDFSDNCEKVLSEYIAFQSKINRLILS